MPLAAARRLTPLALALALALLLAPTACKREPSPQPGAPQATATERSQDPAAHRIEDDVHALADDRMQGRETGTPGHELAADHVARRFAEAGLAPAGDDGGWFQRVPLLRARIDPEGARMEVRLGGATRALAFEDEFVPLASFDLAEAAIDDAPAVFVGQAVHAPGLGHDDFAGLDLRGKVAVFFGGAPERFEPTRRAFHGSLQEKLRGVAERGAIGAVIAGTAADEVRTPWAAGAGNWQRPSMRLRNGDGRAIDAWPGLKVVVPSTPADAKGLLLAAIEDPDPVLFLEPKAIYRNVKGEVADGYYTTPLSELRRVREGTQVTVFCYGAMVPVAEKAARLAQERRGIDVEIIDLRTLLPLDEVGVLDAAKRTGRIVILHEAPRFCGYGAELSALIAENVIEYLDAPIRRVTGFDTPFPNTLEHHYLPDERRVLDASEQVFDF